MNRSRDNSNQNELDLIGYRLGLVDADEARQIESAADDDSLRHLDEILAPLASYDCQPPADLVAKIESRLASDYVLKFSEEVEAESSGKAPFMSASDLLALAAAIVLFVGVFFPSFQSARDRGERIKCANNLRMMGTGFDKYVVESDGFYPYAGAPSSNAVWIPSSNGAPRATSSRQPFLLIKYRIIDPRAFVDPGSAGDRPMDDGNFQGLSDFPNPRNSSYVFWNTPKAWRRWDYMPKTPITAGMTPLVDENRELRNSANAPQNSMNHGREMGQNVLRLDGSVEFTKSPRAGLSKDDDIYRLEGYADDQYTGRERPRGQTDAFLTP